MLNDTDTWPVTCVNCGHIMYEKIGCLKQTVDLTCPHCGIHLKFHRDEFAQSIEQHRRSIEMLARSKQWTERKL
jgi:predicted  nucleic acid-binding Zn-ribbon protein